MVDLFPYQEEAVKWCMEKESECAILALSTGLGKTIVACELLNRKPLKTLIMVPLSILQQWYCELSKFTNKKAIIYHGIKRKQIRSELEKAEVILTTCRVYADEIDADYFADIERWIIDESHRLRNEKGLIYQKLVHATIANKVFLTATPLCNSVKDIAALVNLSNVSEEKWKKGKKYIGVGTVKSILPHVLFRKTKDEIMHILPKKTVYDIIIKEDDTQEYNKHIEDEMVLRRILRMRQCVNYKKKIIEIHKIIATIPKNEKIIIFASLTTILKKIYDSFENQEYLQIYHGKVPLPERNKMIENFKNDDNYRILLINLKAGGTGLNLVEANHSIITDPYWNDAEQDQAINRIYRIGQIKPVHIYKLIVDNSIEKWIALLQKSKLNVSKYLIDKNKEYKIQEIASHKNKVKEIYGIVGEIYMEEFDEEEVQEILEYDFHLENHEELEDLEDD